MRFQDQMVFFVSLRFRAFFRVLPCVSVAIQN